MLEKVLQKPRVLLTSVWLIYCVVFLGSNVSDDGSNINQTGIIIDATITALFVIGLIWMTLKKKAITD
jgi:hypothetical protein